VPEAYVRIPAAAEPRLSIDVVYDRQRLDVNDTVTAVATVVNLMQQPAPMVILDLPIPGGFAIDAGELDELVGSQLIARYEITPRQAIVYLRQLEPGQSLAVALPAACDDARPSHRAGCRSLRILRSETN
jgi:alpha-2-macroglobulin-like protein